MLVRVDLYTLYDNVLTVDERQECINILEAPTWKFAGFSTDPNSFLFWYKELINERFFNTTFFNKILNITGKKLSLQRLYANGQTHGLPGSLHQDDDRDNSYTFLYYANPYWEPHWGGSTVFCKDYDNYRTLQFKPNNGVLFKGNLLHAGLEPTRHFRGLRMTVAFKLLQED